MIIQILCNYNFEKMRSFIKNLVKEYFEANASEFGENARFREFLITKGDLYVEDSYPNDVYGYVMFVEDKRKRLRRSGLYRVQYYRCSRNSTTQEELNKLFANEAVFYGQIWPLIVDDSTRDLVSTLCYSAENPFSKPTMGASIFKCTYRIQNLEYTPALHYHHLLIMAWNIGKFHGRVFEMKARHLSLLSLATRELEVIPSLIDATDVKPFLRKCYNSIVADERFTRSPDVAPGMLRLQELIEELENRLGEQPVVNGECMVVGHGRYSKAAAFFSCEWDKLTIGQWTNVGWKSLADDLVVILFVDAGSELNDVDRSCILKAYGLGLRRTSANFWTPTDQEVWQEVQHRTPFALYAIATRAEEQRRRAGESEVWNNWIQKLVVDRLKVLVTTRYVSLD